MQQANRRGISRRSFLKGLGALALTALPACRKAAQYCIEPEGCPEWQLPGEATCFATCMPWATGALPMLAVCHDGLPTMLQPNPHYAAVRRGLPAFAQATLLDLYTEERPAEPTFNGRPYPAREWLLRVVPEALNILRRGIEENSAPQPSPLHRLEKPMPPHRTDPAPQHAGADKPQWALLIDTARCNGCGACTLACRAENNIPTVGAQDLAQHRDMQWLRIDRYRSPEGKLLDVPTACRQCENAPCEAVCPVHATVHTDEGLNAMVYPRCWGTRYCASACPYEARTFNYRDYALAEQAATARPADPQVSVRTRGVMEKCTYYLQRLNAARRDGSTPQTACQQACPQGAIRLIDLRHDAPAEVLTSFDILKTAHRTIYTINSA